GSKARAGNREAQKKPRLSGAECFGEHVERPHMRYDSTNRRLTRPLRSVCDGDHKGALLRVSPSLRVPSAETSLRLLRGGVLLLDTQLPVAERAYAKSGSRRKGPTEAGP